MATRLGQDCCDSSVTTSAEGQSVIIYSYRPYDLCVRATKSHLV